jgi:RNA polymerase sigma-70 factor (ECF subfamily)
MNTTSEMLFLSYQQGDLQAFKRLYNQNKGPLYRFLLRQTGQKDVTEELYQHIWREVRLRKEVDAGNSFKLYLYGIAHAALLKYYELEYGTLPTSFNVDYFPKRKKNQVAITDERNVATTLLFQLRSLPAAQRMVFLLHAEVGLSVDRISRCIGISREIVKSRLRYAVAFLNSNIDIVDGQERPNFLQIYREVKEINPTITLSHYVISEVVFDTSRPEKVERTKRKRLIKRASSVTSTFVKSLKKFVA